MCYYYYYYYYSLTLARSLEPVSQSAKEHTIHTKCQQRKAKKNKNTHTRRKGTLLRCDATDMGRINYSRKQISRKAQLATQRPCQRTPVYCYYAA